MLVVQQIHATYEKRGRGGVEARRRAELPRALPLPVWSGEPGYVCHDVKAERPNYTMVAEVEARERPPRHGRFLRFDEGIHWRGSEAGAPPRPDVALVLEDDGWTRVRFNGRHNDSHSGECSWWRYLDATLNVGRFSKRPSRDVFLMTMPSRVVDLRRPLW